MGGAPGCGGAGGWELTWGTAGVWGVCVPFTSDYWGGGSEGRGSCWSEAVGGKLGGLIWVRGYGEEAGAVVGLTCSRDHGGGSPDLGAMGRAGAMAGASGVMGGSPYLGAMGRAGSMGTHLLQGMWGGD